MVDISEQELSTSEWKGYVKRALESIDKKLDKIEERMDKVDDNIRSNRIKIGCIAATTSLLMTVVILVLKTVLHI
jgi:archaellum component FlaC